MPELVLHGCTPEPLMSYLKALGVLRLIAEQADPEARAAWRAGFFVLSSKLDADTLMQFFLEEYRPTPIAAPWAGGSGFFGQDNRKAVDAIAGSSGLRLQDYRALIVRVQAILREERQTAKPSNDVKEHLLRRYRRELPDEFVTWMDSALVLQETGQSYPPLLGTGGNDGRLDFTQNFMQRLVDLGLLRTRLAPKAQEWLRHALFGNTVESLMTVAIGQFDPGRAGGPNATQGMEGNSLVNPWDFMLMLEGALLLAGSVARRMATGQRDKAVFSFTVRPSSAGYGSTADADTGTARGEIWLPIWANLTSISELRLVFSEGRAEISGKQCRDGVDFARAVAGLGVDRGLTSFVRFGFLRRSGKAYLTAPLGSFEVRAQRDVDLLQDIDAWLDSFRRACREETTPPRFVAALRQIDAAIFDFCRYGGKPRMAEILYALGNVERQLANGEKFRKTDRRTIHPIPPLSTGWISACDDGTPEYRLALTLASIRGDREGNVGDIRVNLEPVERRGSRWIWAEKSRAVVWSSADLCRNLTAVLTRRIMDAAREGLESLPLGSRFAVSLDDVSLFLSGETDDHRIEQLLWGLILIDRDEGRGVPIEQTPTPPSSPLPLPHLYAMLKLLFLPHKLSWPAVAEAITIKPETEILGRLRSGDVQGACEIAARRLRASGVVPMPGPTSGGTWRRIKPGSHLDPMRLAAALLFPVRGTIRLARLTLRPPAEEVVLRDTDG
jgi:CRISPR-associated protein Csx17